MTIGVADYQFAPEERPTFPGSPAIPTHPFGRRLGYVAVAVLVGVTATLGNALVNVNIASLSGAMGVYVEQASWLPAIYVAFNASAGLALIKARAQFGIPKVTHGLLITYAAAALLQFWFPSFASAVLVRAVSGVAASALVTMTIYNLMQVFPAKSRAMALVIGVGLTQLGSPIARMFPVEMLALDHWQSLHLIELGIALAASAALTALPLPPSVCTKSFEPLDFVTIGLVLPAMILVCGVLSEGRLLWWIDTPWLGWALTAAAPLFAVAACIEWYRERPLIQLRWIGTGEILRFVFVALVVRLALAEQTYGAVGILTSGGLTNDQLRILFALVVAAMVIGMLVAAAIFSEKRLPKLVFAAALFIALGAWIDSSATNLVRPPQLYLSQMLIAFGTTIFMGPALIYGFLRVLRLGANYLVTFIILFNVTQNVGGLVGAAFLGSYQVAATQAHLQALSEHLLATDPQVVARLQSAGTAAAEIIVDPAQRSAQGGVLFTRAMVREANILAYNDVFRLVALMSLGAALFMAYRIIVLRYRQAETKGASG